MSNLFCAGQLASVCDTTVRRPQPHYLRKDRVGHVAKLEAHKAAAGLEHSVGCPQHCRNVGAVSDPDGGRHQSKEKKNQYWMSCHLHPAMPEASTVPNSSNRIHHLDSSNRLHRSKPIAFTAPPPPPPQFRHGPKGDCVGVKEVVGLLPENLGVVADPRQRDVAATAPGPVLPDIQHVCCGRQRSRGCFSGAQMGKREGGGWHFLFFSLVAARQGKFSETSVI